MEHNYIKSLIRVGQNNLLDDRSKDDLLKSGNGYYLYYSENWKNINFTNYSDNDVVALFKGLIIAESCFLQLCGSTSVCILLYREIKKRLLDEELTLANWVFTKTKNGYIPFGTDGRIRRKSKTAFEYIRNKDAYSQSLKIEKEQSETRKLEQRIAGLKAENTDLRNKLQEKKHRLVLSKLTNMELAKIIIEDEDKPVYFYYLEIERLMNDKALPNEYLARILHKFKAREKRNTRLLKNRLIDEINSR